ncbi:MAG TPA: Rrf2 family transcriptional regulator [Thermoanaerobaculia bacterium]|nr:Rrf2 family transcriptional regulator [Thermoanaerobaculia bacterium]
MKLTRRSEYALLALLHLARAKGEGYVAVSAIAEAQGLPPQFLEQLLMALKRARLVKSRKGPHGGYRLARPAEKISLAEVIRLLDGALAPTESVSTYFYEPTPVEREKRLLRVFKEIRDHVSARLEKTTLADVR